MGYIMPFFGLSADFGPFQFGGVLAATGLFELYSSTIDLVSDYEGDRIINYNFTLPIPSWLALIAKATYYFLVYVTLAVVIIPVGKMCLWNQLDMMHISYVKLGLSIIFQSIFYSCFVLWASSIVDSMTKMGHVWSRFIFPMWFMGGFQFSWYSLYKVIPWLSYINLLNPMIYITEAVRVALLGQEGYINFWLCLLLIGIFSILCFVVGLYNLKKRLDFV